MIDSQADMKVGSVDRVQSAASQRLRVLAICGGFHVFGKERIVLELLRGLRDRGYQLQCITNAWSDGNFIRQLESLEINYATPHLGWIYLKKPRWTLATLTHAPRAFAEIHRVYREFQPDVVVHDSYRTIAQLGWLRRKRNVFMVQDYHTAFLQRKLLLAQDRFVAAYVPCSDDVASNLRQIGINCAKIHVVANPVSFHEISDVQSSRHGGKTNIGIVGQIIEQKGHHILIEALGRIKQSCPEADICLKVFGDGPADYRRHLLSISERAGVASWIEWCGYHDDRAQVYRATDFNVVPSINADPSPLAAVEPAVYSRPVIASAAGGLASIVRDGVTGFLVPPSDPVALSERLLDFIQNPGLVAKMGRAAHDDYKIRFDSALFLDRYESIICDVGQRRSGVK